MIGKVKRYLMDQRAIKRRALILGNEALERAKAKARAEIMHGSER